MELACMCNCIFGFSFCHDAAVFERLYRYCFKEESHARNFQCTRPHLCKVIEFQARVGYVKKISATTVSGKQQTAHDSRRAQSALHHRSNSSSSAMELIFNYSHYMYGALWVADDSVDGEKGTVRVTIKDDDLFSYFDGRFVC